MATQSEQKVLRRGTGDVNPIHTLVEELGDGLLYGEVSVNPANLAAGAEGDTVVALPAGTAPVGSLVFVQPPSDLEAGLYARRFWINAADSLTITIRNETAGAVDGAAKNWTFLVVKHKKITHL